MGFNNEYIKNIQSLKGEYFCPVCRNLACPDDCLQTRCGHLYCKPCLALVVQTNKTCPYDGLLVSEIDSKPLVESDIVLADTIWQVTVGCLFEKSGCMWEGPMCECVAHTSRCIFGSYPVICNHCGVEIAHRHIHEHSQICIPTQQAPSPSQLEVYSVHSQPQTYAPQLQVGTQPVSQGMAILVDYAPVPYDVQSYIPQRAVLMPQYEQPRPWLHSNVQHYLHPQTHQNILVEQGFSLQSHPPQGQLFIPSPDSGVPQRATLIPLERPMFPVQPHPPLIRGPVSIGLHQGSHDSRLGNPQGQWVVMSPFPPQLIPLQRPLLPLQPPQRLNSGMMPVGIPLLVPQDINAGQLRPSNPMVENSPTQPQEILVQLPSPKQSQDDINGRHGEPKASTKFEASSSSSPPPGFPVPAFAPSSSGPLPTRQGESQGLVGVDGGHIGANKAHSFEERSKGFSFPGGVQPESGVNLDRPRGGKPPLPRKPVAQRALEKTNHGNIQAYSFLNNGPGEGSGSGSYPDGVDLSNHKSRKRNLTGLMCEICNVGCETMEGLDVHFQTAQHRKKAMDIISHIKPRSLKKHKLSIDHQYSLKVQYPRNDREDDGNTPKAK